VLFGSDPRAVEEFRSRQINRAPAFILLYAEVTYLSAEWAL